MKVLRTEFITFKDYIIREGFVNIEVKDGITMNGLTNIRYLLNILVMTRFKLQPYPTQEGGIRGKEVHLVNSRYSTLGLERDISFGRRPSDTEKKILSWYREILHHLFIKGNAQYPDPSFVWFNSKYSSEIAAKFSLLRNACILAEWKGKDESYKENFFDFTFVKKITEVTKNHLLDGDYLVPEGERGILKEKKSVTFVSGS